MDMVPARRTVRAGWRIGGRAAQAQPSEYFKRQCFISVDVDEELIADTVRQLGADCFVISTDFPHIDSKGPHALDSFLAIRGLDKKTQKKILWDNCARLYNVQ